MTRESVDGRAGASRSDGPGAAHAPVRRQIQPDHYLVDV